MESMPLPHISWKCGVLENGTTLNSCSCLWMQTSDIVCAGDWAGCENMHHLDQLRWTNLNSVQNEAGIWVSAFWTNFLKYLFKTMRSKIRRMYPTFFWMKKYCLKNTFFDPSSGTTCFFEKEKILSQTFALSLWNISCLFLSLAIKGGRGWGCCHLSAGLSLPGERLFFLVIRDSPCKDLFPLIGPCQNDCRPAAPACVKVGRRVACLCIGLGALQGMNDLKSSLFFASNRCCIVDTAGRNRPLGSIGWSRKSYPLLPSWTNSAKALSDQPQPVPETVPGSVERQN